MQISSFLPSLGALKTLKIESGLLAPVSVAAVLVVVHGSVQLILRSPRLEVKQSSRSLCSDIVSDHVVKIKPHPNHTFN